MPKKIGLDEGRSALAAVASAAAAADKPARHDLATAVRYLLQLLVEKAPGASVEVWARADTETKAVAPTKAANRPCRMSDLLEWHGL